MSKVGVLTFHYSDNNGAVLQAYGLSKALQEMGHDVEIVDYRPLAARLRYSGHWPKHAKSFLRVAYKRWKFHRFRHSYLPLSRTYLSLTDLEKAPPEADYFVCGSDQVWNIASFRGFDPAFFLAFLKDSGPRRVSYAATFGNAEDLGGYRRSIGELLSRFDHLSVRDLKSQRMVRDLVDRFAEHVLDPSFLADYGPITPPPVIKPPYVLMNYFGRTELSADAVRVLRNHFKIPIVSIGRKVHGTTAVNTGPVQWLSLMRHADFVCTNSFHGTCFSLINRKPFVMLPNQGAMSRLEDILQTAGLADRLVCDSRGLEKALGSQIDYSAVSLRINEARERSFAYLRHALK
jgi:hypothetical protein